jgi:hypothetical protein
MKNEVMGLVQHDSSIPVGFPVCTELTPSNVGNMSARILAVMSAAHPVSSSDIRGMIATRFGKRYENLDDFAAKLRFLLGTGHLQEDEHSFMLTDKGASLVAWIEAARPQMLQRSTSANDEHLPH